MFLKTEKINIYKYHSVKRVVYILFFLMVTSHISAQNYYTLRGIVTDSLGMPMQGVQVSARMEEEVTRSNAKGEFKLRLQEGLYTIVFNYLGYKQTQMNLALHQDVYRKIILLPESQELGLVNVKGNKKDRGLEIMRNAINKREYWLKHIQSLESKVYIRASDETNKKKKKTTSFEDSIRALMPDTIRPDINLAEFQYIRYWQYPNKIKEIKEAGKIVGQKQNLFYLTTTEAEFNFYKSTIQNRGLSENTFLSPLSPLAPLSYKFDLKGFYYENGLGVYKIKVTPRAMGNALFSGDIYIVDSLWSIYRINLSIEGSKLNEFHSMQIKQDYILYNDSLMLLPKQEYIYTRKVGKKTTEGRTICIQSDFKINPEFPKKFFGDELMSAKDDAYDKTSTWWDSVRAVPLNVKEIQAINYSDSIKMAHERKEYLDSIDSVTNRVTFWNVMWWGQSHVNRKKQEYYSFQSVAEMFLNSFFNGVVLGGPRVVLNFNYYKKFKNRRVISTSPNLSYGFKYKDVKGSLGFDWVYNPIKRGELSVNVGSQFDLIFPYDAYLNVFKSTNFYEHKFVNIDNTIELVNGLYLSGYMQLSTRQSVVKYGFQTAFDTLYGVKGKPVDFNTYNAFTGEVRLRYTPHQLYLREPKEKIILGSRWPMFQIRYRKGIPDIVNSIVNFDYVEFQIRQKFSMKLLGNAEYNIKTGTFLNTSKVYLIDYKYHRKGDPYLFTNPLQTYQLLDSSFPTFNLFLEGHYYHRFNGYFTNKIPLFKKLKLNEVAGAAFLYAPEVKKTHAEVFIGLEKAIKVLGRSFRLGVYSAYGVTNGDFVGRGFKFSIEYFDPVRNRWQF